MQLVDAYLKLVENGDRRPRALSVAEQAGVSLRTLYHHFDRLSALAEAAIQSDSDRRLESLPDVDGDGSLAGRIDALVRARDELFDSASQLAEANVAVGQPTRSLERARGTRSVLRRQIERTFQRELALEVGSARLLLDAVDAVTSADTWEYLRSELGRSPDEAREVMGIALNALLAPRPPVEAHRASSV
jgi:AcrR family transcriptional regulator